MKYPIYILIILVTTPLVLFHSCCPDAPAIKPNQVLGRDTLTESFSTCIINGESWSSCAQLGGGPIEVSYDVLDSKVLIEFVKFCSDTFSVVSFDLKGTPKEDLKLNLGEFHFGRFYRPNLIDLPKRQETYGDSSGYINFYKGSLHNSLSGHYTFTGYHDNLGYINITDGRFYNVKIDE